MNKLRELVVSGLMSLVMFGCTSQSEWQLANKSLEEARNEREIALIYSKSAEKTLQQSNLILRRAEALKRWVDMRDKDLKGKEDQINLEWEDQKKRTKDYIRKRYEMKDAEEAFAPYLLDHHSTIEAIANSKFKPVFIAVDKDKFAKEGVSFGDVLYGVIGFNSDKENNARLAIGYDEKSKCFGLWYVPLSDKGCELTNERIKLLERLVYKKD